jgi:hypothetical protein
MGHARVGDTIKIIGLNGADWVMVGKEYYVESVSEGYDSEDSDDSEMVYELRDVHSSWCGEPRHFEIVKRRDDMVHPKYDTFHKGNIVRRWRDVKEWEWECIGQVTLPPIGEDVDVDGTDMGHSGKVPSFYSKERQYWYPMKAFVLAEYYHHTITTNRGTAELNTDYNGESKITSSSGIEVQRVAPSIVSGKRTSRSGVQSRGNATIVRGRYSRHEAVTGK